MAIMVTISELATLQSTFCIGSLCVQPPSTQLTQCIFQVAAASLSPLFLAMLVSYGNSHRYTALFDYSLPFTCHTLNNTRLPCWAHDALSKVVIDIHVAKLDSTIALVLTRAFFSQPQLRHHMYCIMITFLHDSNNVLSLPDPLPFLRWGELAHETRLNLVSYFPFIYTHFTFSCFAIGIIDCIPRIASDVLPEVRR